MARPDPKDASETQNLQPQDQNKPDIHALRQRLESILHVEIPQLVVRNSILPPIINLTPETEYKEPASDEIAGMRKFELEVKKEVGSIDRVRVWSACASSVFIPKVRYSAPRQPQTF